MGGLLVTVLLDVGVEIGNLVWGNLIVRWDV